ncbi:Vacuolar protein sorting-associated protein 54 [Liparis tanakae]|uniref:Vacuolar protein sorting-associated protein 54 n=1 Tax=Liparis tanakae TaxID=230148 RepID=A0A4Z2E454_9TELE|nr:Vacuolar protein sorting-associated protein 54 [Liparis tanakae]
MTYLLLDNERWKQAEVPAEFQDLVNSIADGRITLPERKVPGPEDRKPADFLLVDGQKYAVVGTVLLLIRIFLEYCQCVNDIPSIATDMLTRLSDLLKVRTGFMAVQSKVYYYRDFILYSILYIIYTVLLYSLFYLPYFLHYRALWIIRRTVNE